MEKGLGTDSFGIWTSIKQADLAQDKNALLTTPYPPWERGRGGGSPLLEWTVLRSRVGWKQGILIAR